MKKKLLSAFVNENGEKLTVDSWKIITHCQSAEYDKFVDLKKKTAKDVMAIFQSHAYQDKKIKQIRNDEEGSGRVNELKRSLSTCK